MIPTAITSPADAAIVKGMAHRHDRQSDIAAWFGVNPGRIANVINGRAEGAKFKDVPPAPEHALPPPGPYSYFTPRDGMSLPEQLQQALAALDLKWAQGMAQIREELRISAVERRQTNEKLDHVMRQLLEARRNLGQVEVAKPKPTRRRPLAS